jgi:ssDNA-binding Zn-finger/Zn-ribbon topoisomerase 1
MLSILAGWAAGWAAGALRNRPLERRRLAERRAEYERIEAEIKAKAQTDGIACPLCGFPLRMRRMGKSKRGYFMGCTHYPACTGWRPASQAERDEALARRIE